MFILHLLLFQSGPLLRAAYEGDVDKVKELLLEGIPVDISNQVFHLSSHASAECCLVISPFMVDCVGQFMSKFFQNIAN